MKQAVELGAESRPGPDGSCLSTTELRVRAAEWRRLADDALVEAREESDRLVLVYRKDAQVEEVLRDLVSRETICCSSLRFQVLASAQQLRLTISGPWRQTPWANADPTREEPRPGNMREFVRQRYAALARRMVLAGDLPDAPAGGCGAVYDPDDLAQLRSLRGVGLGCGNAIGVAGLKQGDTVLDLGSGAGLDAFVAARRIGPSGKIYGLDMTDEMLRVARENQAAAGLLNVEFLKGYIEQIPLPEGAVDVIVSNCVINLSVSKTSVFAEMFRVLKPGGRVALSDVVADQPPAGPADPNAWAACISGALTRSQYREGLSAAGFRKITIEESHEIQPGRASVLVKARKPASQ